jgi:hypothetical protein
VSGFAAAVAMIRGPLTFQASDRRTNPESVA